VLNAFRTIRDQLMKKLEQRFPRIKVADT